MTELVQLSLFDLETLEGKVRAGLKSFIDVGDALVKIREGNGFKLRGFETFDDYVEKTFGFSVRHGQRLIAAAETAHQVERLTGEAPRSESVAREIKRVTFSPAAVKAVQTELKKAGTSIATAKAEVIAKVITGVLRKSTTDAADKPVRSPAPHTTAAPADSSPSLHMDSAPPLIASLASSSSSSTFCPNCGVIPDAYTRDGKSWRCGECGGKVTISVSLEGING